MRRIILLLIVLVISIFTSFCFSQLSGKASYYAHRFHGRRMSDGAPYHKDSLTCAHRTLPFGTLLEVRNPRNNKTVVVKVTDRGPYIRNRIIDLSYAAAKELGIVHMGVAHVEINERIIIPFAPIVILPFDRHGLLIPAKTTEDVRNNMNADQIKVLQ
ncbi:MAG: septal ring lytic transglycosylase RlpA family protein [Proteiniphilum sp.]|jgi:rare lipoprotein A|nr:septal ring lytic transglycosylase RlpA family protein [Proteiniphilum sp.]